MKRHRLAAAISLLVVAGTVYAQGPRLVAPQTVAPDQLTDAMVANTRLLLTRAGAFDPTQEQVDFASTGAAPNVAIARYAIVQFADGDKTGRERLEKQNVRVLGYVPNNAFIVKLDETNTLASLSRQSNVRWSGLYQPGMKLDPRLYTNARTRLITAPTGGIDVEIFAFSGESAERIAEGVTKAAPGARVTVVNARDENPYVRVNVDATRVDALVRGATALEGVSWVAPYLQPSFENSAAVGTIQGNSLANPAGSGAVEAGKTPIWDHNIFGSGQIVAVSDSGADANEAWFTTLDKGSGPVTAVATAQTPAPPTPGTLAPTQKVIGYWVQPGATAFDNTATCPGGSPTSFHGTHTSGTVLGDTAGTFASVTYLASTPTAANHELADGMAPNAQLLFLDIGNDTSGCLSITDLTGTLQQGYGGGARIHSASWGAPTGGIYSGNDFEADFALSKAEDMIFVVSAGNEGSGNQTTGSPGNSKNAITVGALGHGGSVTVASFSSRGPTADGRRKPDVMAPGSSTISASGDATTNATPEAPLTKSLSGTSMSAPTVSGNAALMRQFFADGWYPRGTATAADKYNPSGMAMKATILNGTNAISTTNWNSNGYGWGRMWLDSNLWFANTLTGGDDSRRLRLFERTQAAGLKTGDQHEYTIANVGIGQELRATLTWYDIEAQQGSLLSLVNNLDLEVVGPGGTYLGNVFTAGISTTGGTADVRNTVEQFRLIAPVAGSYTFRVKGTSVPGGSRPNTNRQGYALAVSGAFGLPATTAFPAPTAVSATNSANQISVAFTSGAGAQGYQLYRADGTCASANAGDFRLVGSGAASPLVDTTPRNGQAYAYKVRGISGDVEGDVSNCVDVTSTAACTLQPEFDNDSLAVTSTQSATCKVGLGWSAAPANCPTATGVTYAVQRDSTPYFTAPTTIAPAVTATTYDDFAVGFGNPYFYRVTATDSLGNSAPTSHSVNATPIGPSGIRGSNYLDDGDNRIYSTLEAPWRVTNTGASAGTLSYHSGFDNVNYPSDTCAAVTTPQMLVPAGATLAFKARYNFEYQWDGMVMEISTDNGATWSDLPPDGGYPSTLAETLNPPINACGYPNTHGAFTGVSTAASNADPNNGTATAVFKPFTRTLASYAGQNVRIRWRVTADGSAEFAGAFLDEMRINSDVIFADGFQVDALYTCSPQ